MLSYQIVNSDTSVSIPPHLGKYKCLLLTERHVGETLRNEVSRKLVNTGCAFAMAWGPDCSLWDDSIDLANIEKFKDRAIPDEQFVMTTWHEKETLQEVLRFAKIDAAVSYSNDPLNDLLVLDFSHENRAAFIEEAYDRAE